MITVVDIGVGNIGSVKRALSFLGAEYELAQEPAALKQASKILFPGVGSFCVASGLLDKQEWKQAIRHEVLVEKKPLFGICLGMQLLFSRGFEGDESSGLDLLQGSVVGLKIDREKFKIPHMGWNSVDASGLSLFNKIPDNSDFYFVHSFEVSPEDPEIKVAYTTYGDHKIPAAVQKGHIYGVQFHPERSQKVGLQILKNYLELPC